MTVRVFSARVKAGAIVPEDDVSLPEGSRVTVIAEASAEGFELSTADEDELLESIAEADRGETISAADLLQRLQR
jgi:hypothetical protein